MKAVIPAAGLGTRLLPATKVLPKELLPVFDVPVLQLVVEEAMSSGADEIVLVISPNKAWMVDHFASQGELIDTLRQRGKRDLAERVASISAPIRTVVQERPLGLGHAVLCAREAVAGETFALLLPDDLFDCQTPAIRQLLDHHAQTGRSVVGLEEVAPADVHRYGIVRPSKDDGRAVEIADLIEKPAVEQAPSRLAIPGRYVLDAGIFDFIAKTQPGTGGEIQITDALRGLAAKGSLDGLRIEGVRMDAGHPFGLLEASVRRACHDAKMRSRVRALLATLPH